MTCQFGSIGPAVGPFFTYLEHRLESPKKDRGIVRVGVW